MTISALSSNLISDLSSQQQNPFRKIRQDFGELAKALQNGDLSEAQSAYSSIQQILGNNSSSSSSDSPSVLQTDFAALGQALQMGDLGQAQSAFSQLQNDAASQAPGSGAGSGSPTTPAPVNDWYQSQASQGQNPIEEALQDYSLLANDIQNGDLADAQTAYSSLQQLLQTFQGQNTTSGSPNNALQSDFATLGQDIQSGNVSATQSAFAQLQTDLQAATTADAIPNTTAATSASATTDSQGQTQTLTPAQQVQQDYAQLASDLQNGNLSGAQTAFTALEQALQTQTSSSSTSTSASSSSSNDPISNDFNALGQALSSGNLSQAQSAFSQLQGAIQAAQQSASAQGSDGRRAERHHHHGDWSNQISNQNSSSTTNSETTSTSSVNLYA